MSLEQLTRKAIDARLLDGETFYKIQGRVNRAAYLTPEEYEALRHLGQALRTGEVVRAY